MTYPITDTECTATLSGGATVTGRIWTFPPLFPWSGDETAEATTYTNRNKTKTRSVEAYLGITYGTTAQRWSAPVAASLTGTVDATEFPDVPYQGYVLEDEFDPDDPSDIDGRPEWGLSIGNYEWRGFGTAEVEYDNLPLNLWTSSTSGSKPVIVYIHGGGAGVNSINEFQTMGHRLATEDVVVVKPGYRLSTFGFFHHPDLEGESGWAANLAILDLILALQWVRDEIANFGGDPDNVTLMGTSFGGAAAQALLANATAQSLIHKVWISSGGGLVKRWQEGVTAVEGYANRYDRFKRVVETIAPYVRSYADTSETLQAHITRDGILDAMRNAVSPAIIQEFADGGQRFTGILSGSTTRAYTASENVYPFKDGVTISDNSVVDAANAGNLADIPMVVGFAEHEASLVGGATPTINENYFASLLGFMTAAQLYTSAGYDGAWSSDERKRILYRHAVFELPARLIAEAHADNGNDTWLYFWNYADGGQTYAGHSTDMAYLFGNVEWSVALTAETADAEAKVTAQCLLMSDGMMKSLVAFARAGDPDEAYTAENGFDLFATEWSASNSWTAYTSATKTVNIIGKEARNATDAPATLTAKASPTWWHSYMSVYRARLGL